MHETRRSRHSLALAVLLSASACATASGPWDGPDRTAIREPTPTAAPGGGAICPVVLTNLTDQQLDAGYVLGGVQSELGLLPAGRSLSFGVSCSSGSIEAFGFAKAAFLGEGPEYRASASLERERPTRLGLTIVNRIR